jgi:16S rRNA (cytosine967-C5)-methyltransferase
MAVPAPLTIRVNSLKLSRSELQAKLLANHIEAEPTHYSPYGLTLGHKAQLMNNPLFTEGLFEVQDEASQVAGLLLQPKRSEMIADFCAGSGGKTLLFGMLMRNSGRIYAFDVNERRLGNLTPRLARSGLSNVYPQVISSENDLKIKRLAGKLERVFVDAPCLGLGTLRRNPDLKFRQSEAALTEITQKQLAILTAASNLLKPKGRLIYATCSILPQENQEIIKQFLAAHPNFCLVPIAQILSELQIPLSGDEYLAMRPDLHNSDGFFAAVMEKSE